MEQWCVQAYAKKREPELEKEGFQLRYDSFGLYYYGTFTNDHVKSIRRQLRHLHIKYLMYAQRWERSSTYRKNFLKSSNGPYKCRYCRKFLRQEDMVVDHIVPVAKTKKSLFYRDILYLQGIGNVNDIRNLAPSCQQCNIKKGSKGGWWTIKGFLGKYEAFWICLRILVATVIICGISMICSFVFYKHDALREMIRTLLY